MAAPKDKPVYSVIIVYPTVELEVTVYSNVAKGIVNGFAANNDSIAFMSVNGTYYVVDFRHVLYIKAKHWVVEME